MIDSNEAWNRIAVAGKQFFSVSFQRKNDKVGKDENGKKVVIEPAGTIRKMLCRRGVKKYAKGVLPPGQRKAEDIRCNVLTVFDVQEMAKLRKSGMRMGEAGRKSYRRINMAEVVDISIPQTVPLSK